MTRMEPVSTYTHTKAYKNTQKNTHTHTVRLTLTLLSLSRSLSAGPVLLDEFVEWQKARLAAL